MKYKMMILLLFLQAGLYAQNIDQSETSNTQQLTRELARQVELEKQLSGNRAKTLNLDKNYLNPDWNQGFKLNKDMKNVGGTKTFYRYDVMHDRMEKMTILQPEEGQIYSFAGHFMIYTSYISTDGYKEKGYFEMLNKGTTKLLLKRDMGFQAGTDDIEAYGSSSSSGIQTSYYIKYNNKPAVHVDKDKEAILKALPAHQEEMADFMKSRYWFGIWTEKQLKHIVKHYNSL